MDLNNAIQEMGSHFSFEDQMDKNEVRWLGLVLEYPVIVTLGEVSKKAITEIREWYFPNVKEWDHFHIPHPSGLNRKLNDPEAHHEAVRQLKAAYSKLLTLKVYEGKIQL